MKPHISTDDRAESTNISRWWVSTNGELQGHFSEVYVGAALRSGRLGKDTLLCPVGGGNAWKPAHEWVEFSGAGETAPRPVAAARPAAITEEQKHSGPGIASFITSIVLGVIQTAAQFIPVGIGVSRNSGLAQSLGAVAAGVGNGEARR